MQPFQVFHKNKKDSFALASSCAFTLKQITALVIIFLFQKLLLDEKQCRKENNEQK